jgi:hypothetical protein
VKTFLTIKCHIINAPSDEPILVALLFHSFVENILCVETVYERPKFYQFARKSYELLLAEQKGVDLLNILWQTITIDCEPLINSVPTVLPMKITFESIAWIAVIS